MRIGIDYTPAVNQSAGIGRYVRGLVGALTTIDRQNDYVLFQSRGHNPNGSAVLERSNVTLRPIGVSERTLTILWHRLRLPLPIDLFTGPVDLFHFPNFALAPLRRGTAVVTVHDLSFLVMPECAEERLRIYLEQIVPASVAAADFVVTDSASVRNELICLLDVPPDRVEVVYAGVDERFQRIADATTLQAVRKKYGLDFPFILFVGTVEPRKNLTRLIRAYDVLRQQHGIAHKLVIAGGFGWLYQSVLQEVDALDLAEDVRFIGYVEDGDLPALYSLADVFAWPSLYEGFGLPPLEAMACETPVVTSTAAAVAEVVGDAALTVDPHNVDAIADALYRALTDEQVRADLRSRGLARSRLFTWHTAAEKLLAVYQRAVGAVAASTAT